MTNGLFFLDIVKNEDSGPPADTPFDYLIVLFPNDGGDSKNIDSESCILRFFLLVNYKGNRATYDMTAPAERSLGSVDPLQEYVDSGFYLKDIVRYAEKRIENLIEKVCDICNYLPANFLC